MTTKKVEGPKIGRPKEQEPQSDFPRLTDHIDEIAIFKIEGAEFRTIDTKDYGKQTKLVCKVWTLKGDTVTDLGEQVMWWQVISKHCEDALQDGQEWLVGRFVKENRWYDLYSNLSDEEWRLAEQTIDELSF